MAELFKFGARGSPLWFLSAIQAATTVITDASGVDEELGTDLADLASVPTREPVMHSKELAYDDDRGGIS